MKAIRPGIFRWTNLITVINICPKSLEKIHRSISGFYSRSKTVFIQLVFWIVFDRSKWNDVETQFFGIQPPVVFGVNCCELWYVSGYIRHIGCNVSVYSSITHFDDLIIFVNSLRKLLHTVKIVLFTSSTAMTSGLWSFIFIYQLKFDSKFKPRRLCLNFELSIVRLNT